MIKFIGIAKQVRFDLKQNHNQSHYKYEILRCFVPYDFEYDLEILAKNMSIPQYCIALIISR